MQPAPHESPSVPRALLNGALAGWTLGALWGGLETFGRVLYFDFGDTYGIKSLPHIGIADVVAATILSAFQYGVVGLALGALGALVLVPIFRRALREKNRALAEFAAPRFAVIATAVFASLFWFSKTWFHFALSERFYSPRRLMFSAALLVVSALAASILSWVLWRAPRFRTRNAVLSLVGFCVLASACELREHALLTAKTAGRAGRWNVVLVIVDALRADHLGCYGYPKPTSPRIDAIARESVVFDRAVTQAPFTWTSFGSIFTGKYPRHHGLLKMDPTVRFNPRANLTLQRVLDAAGYKTGAFMTGMISNASGLIDGFSSYLETTIARDRVERDSNWTFLRSELVLRRAWNKMRQAFDPSLVADEAVDWMDQVGDQRFFTVLHLYSTHTPYDPPKRFDKFSPNYDGGINRYTNDMTRAIQAGKWSPSEADVERIRALYDGGVNFADAMIGGVVEELLRRGRLDDTVIVITADHGEELGEHDLWEHDWMYNTNQLVPLIVRIPDGRGRGQRVATPVELIDILPTVLDLVGIAAPSGAGNAIDGRSLVPWLEPEAPKDAFAFCENKGYISVQDREWKLVRARDGDPNDPPRLFHLAADPGEERDPRELGAAHPDQLQRLMAVLDAHEKKFVEVVQEDVRPLDQATLDQLREGGYMSGDKIREGTHENRRKKKGDAAASKPAAPEPASRPADAGANGSNGSAGGGG